MVPPLLVRINLALLLQVTAAEQEHGVAGFRDTQDQMESVVAQKADLDQQKGRMVARWLKPNF